jgi:hypothetical protein
VRLPYTAIGSLTTPPTCPHSVTPAPTLLPATPVLPCSGPGRRYPPPPLTDTVTKPYCVGAMGGACRRTGRWELLPTPTSLFSAAAARAGEVDAGVGQVAGSSGGRRVQGVGGRPARGATPNRRCADASGSWPPARRCARRDGLRRHRRPLIPITCATRRGRGGAWGGARRHRRPLRPHHQRHAQGDASGCGEGWGGPSSTAAPVRWKERQEERKERR